MTVMKVAVGFYTGEYTNTLLKEVFGQKHTVWVNSIHREDFEAGYDAAGGTDLGEAQSAAWGDYVHHYLTRAGFDPSLLVELASTEGYQDVLMLSGEQRHLLTIARAFGQLLERDAREDNIGADDGTYDYFPDAVEALYQLCRGIGARWTYVSAVQHIAGTAKYKDLVEDKEVEFPRWEHKEVKA